MSLTRRALSRNSPNCWSDDSSLRTRASAALMCNAHAVTRAYPQLPASTGAGAVAGVEGEPARAHGMPGAETAVAAIASLFEQLAPST